MKSRNLLIGLICILGTSCNHFLEVSPENAVTPTNFFKSESDFQQAVNGIYAPLQGLYDNGAYADWTMSEMHSDNTHFIFNPSARGQFEAEQVSTFLEQSDNQCVADIYNACYRIVSRANQVLTTIDQADFDEAEKDNFKGQALFLRAFAFFHLVRYYGDVPLPLEPATSLKETSLSRTPADKVYEQIVADAGAAAGLLPSRDQQAPGRATSGAANALLGEVYLTLRQWDKAEAALKKITGYSLLPDYASIFDPANESNDEMIFAVQYQTGTSQSLYSSFPYVFIPELADPSSITHGPGGRQGGSGWNTPSPDLIAAYEDTVHDKRYAASIGYVSGPSPIAGITYNHTPYIKKYQHAHTLFSETDQNWPIYRYAGVLLMLAETINEQGGRVSESQSYLNQVRHRAGLPNTTAGDQASLRAAILHERRIELAFENKRWFDLVRTGNAVDVMNAYGDRMKANPEKYYYYVANTGPVEASYNVTQEKLLYPIPLREIQLNPGLTQNAGY